MRKVLTERGVVCQTKGQSCGCHAVTVSHPAVIIRSSTPPYYINEDVIKEVIFMQVNTGKSAAKNVAVLGIFSALAVVSSTWLTLRVGEFIKISPVFLVVALAANMYGVWGAALVAFVSDLIQSLISGLGFSPLISAVNVFCAVIFGLILHNSKSFSGITLSVLITQIIGGLVLNTLALHLYFGIPLVPMVYWRALQCGILIVAEILTLWLVLSVLDVPSRLKSIGRK